MNINIVDADGILHQTIFSGGSSKDTVVNDTLRLKVQTLTGTFSESLTK